VRKKSKQKQVDANVKPSCLIETSFWITRNIGKPTRM